MRVLLGCLVLAGCNQLLDHEYAEQVNSLSDRDSDGVIDERDNCPDVANPEQGDVDGDRTGDACDSCPEHRPTRDRDGDGVDDACDTCLNGPEIDDDSDGVMDACDLCPVSFATEQLDQDGDLVGDACDMASNRFNRHVLVETFATLDPAIWSGAESFAHDPQGTSIVSTLPEAVLAWTGGETMPVVSVAFASGDDGVLRVGAATTCELRCTQGTCTLHLASDPPQTTPVSFSTSARRGVLRMYTEPPPLSGPVPDFTEVSCDVVGTATLRGMELDDLRPQLTIHATTGIRIDGVDLVE